MTLGLLFIFIFLPLIIFINLIILVAVRNGIFLKIYLIYFIFYMVYCLFHFYNNYSLYTPDDVIHDVTMTKAAFKIQRAWKQFKEYKLKIFFAKKISNWALYIYMNPDSGFISMSKKAKRFMKLNKSFKK